MSFAKRTHPLPTTQEKTLHVDITRWPKTKSGWLYSLQPRWRHSIQSAKIRLGADCGSDHELLIAKFRPKMKKVEKNTRPFRYDLNQISYNYAVEMTNRFKGLDLIDRVPEQLMDRGLWHCTGDRDQDHPQGKEMQKRQLVVWGALTNSCEKKRHKRQRIKWKIYPSECRVPKKSKGRKKRLLQWSMQRNRGKQQNGKD